MKYYLLTVSILQRVVLPKVRCFKTDQAIFKELTNRLGKMYKITFTDHSIALFFSLIAKNKDESSDRNNVKFEKRI